MQFFFKQQQTKHSTNTSIVNYTVNIGTLEQDKHPLFAIQTMDEHVLYILFFSFH